MIDRNKKNVSVQCTSTSTTTNRVGVTIKEIFKAEAKASEAASIVVLFREVVKLGIGTPDIEKAARVLARQDDNKRGRQMLRYGLERSGGAGGGPRLSPTTSQAVPQASPSERTAPPGVCKSNGVGIGGARTQPSPEQQPDHASQEQSDSVIPASEGGGGRDQEGEMGDETGQDSQDEDNKTRGRLVCDETMARDPAASGLMATGDVQGIPGRAWRQEEMKRDKKMCDREPGLVVKVGRIKCDQALAMRDQARKKIRSLKMILKKEMTRENYMTIVKKLSMVRTRVWTKGLAKAKKKIEFMNKKLGQCCQQHQEQRGANNRHKRLNNPSKVSNGKCVGTRYKIQDVYLGPQKLP